MKPRLDALLQNRIVRWVSWVQAHARAVTGTSFIITLFLGAYVALELGVNSDNMSLISDNLPSQQDSDRFKELFPSLDDALLVVIDGDTPELTRSATEGLERVLSRNRELFTEVYLPGGGDFFERNGLLYLSLDDLDVFADQMSRFQPLMAELEVDPSIANLAKLIEEGLEQAHEDKSGGEDEWVNVLDHVSEAVASIYEEGPLRVSWEEVLLRESPIETVTRRTIVVHPVLDPTQVFLAGAAMDEIRAAAARLDLDPEHGITVRITGNPAINYEEMLGILWDIATAGGLTVKVAAALVTLPAPLVTTPSKVSPLSASAVVASVRVEAISPGMATPLRRH